jgi:hypothetical protein
MIGQLNLKVYRNSIHIPVPQSTLTKILAHNFGELTILIKCFWIFFASTENYYRITKYITVTICYITLN